MKRWLTFDKTLFKVTTSMGTLHLFPLILPMLFELIMDQLQGTVNTAVLSHYSEISVAAVGAANTIINVTLLFGSVMAIGATVVISNYIGANDEKKTQEVSYTAIVVCTVLALLMTPVILLLSKDILILLNLQGEVLSEALVYFNNRSAFLVVSMMTSVILALLKCYGFPKYTVWIGLLKNAVNLILNIYVIYLPQYSPVTGVEGVAYSCSISNVVGLAVAIWALVKLGIRIKKPDTMADLVANAGRILKIGLPAGLSIMSFTISQMVTTGFVALIGDYALSAKVYYTNILSYVYLFSVSAGNANALLVGRCYGAGDYEKADRMNAQLVKITAVVNFLISLSVVLLRTQLIGMFTDDPKIIALSLGIFAVDIVTEQARAVSHVYEHALRAAGDVLFSVVILTISCWVCSIGLAYVLSVTWGLGLIGCWLGLALDESIRAVVTYFRWRSGKWKRKRVSISG